jgi:hypothetical protein
MKFEIAFNRGDKNDTKEFYEFIGAKLNDLPEEDYYEIEINSFEELEQLMNKINRKYFENPYNLHTYSAVLAFSRPAIFLDKDV